jgi:hypothetical protein
MEEKPSYNVGNVNYSGRMSQDGGYSKKLKIELLYVLAIPLQNIYLKEIKSAHNRYACTPMFITALFH